MDQIVTSTDPFAAPRRRRSHVPARAASCATPVEPPIRHGTRRQAAPAAAPQPPTVATSAHSHRNSVLRGAAATAAVTPAERRPPSRGSATPSRSASRSGAGRIQLDSRRDRQRGRGPTWNERAHPKAWTDSPPVVVDARPLPPQHRASRFTGRREDTPVVADRPARSSARRRRPREPAARRRRPDAAAPLGRAAAPAPDRCSRRGPGARTRAGSEAHIARSHGARPTYAAPVADGRAPRERQAGAVDAAAVETPRGDPRGRGRASSPRRRSACTRSRRHRQAPGATCGG